MLNKVGGHWYCHSKHDVGVCGAQEATHTISVNTIFGICWRLKDKINQNAWDIFMCLKKLIQIHYNQQLTPWMVTVPWNMHSLITPIFPPPVKQPSLPGKIKFCWNPHSFFSKHLMEPSRATTSISNTNTAGYREHTHTLRWDNLCSYTRTWTPIHGTNQTEYKTGVQTATSWCIPRPVHAHSPSMQTPTSDDTRTWYISYYMTTSTSESTHLYETNTRTDHNLSLQLNYTYRYNRWIHRFLLPQGRSSDQRRR